MTRVSSSEHVLLLLRERLQRLGRGRSPTTARAGSERESIGAPLARLQALAAVEQLTDEDFRRTMVRALLSEELGESLSNDASFQVIADDVLRIISASEEGRKLLEGAARELRATK